MRGGWHRHRTRLEPAYGFAPDRCINKQGYIYPSEPVFVCRSNWCFNTIGWTAYVYQTNTLHCFTKIGKLESPAALYVPDPTSFCGVLNLNYNEINWNGNNYAAFCDHPGSDIQNYTNIMSAENCSTLCVNNPLCTHIVYRPTVHQKYITPVNNLCFLKGFFKRWECFTS